MKGVPKNTIRSKIRKIRESLDKTKIILKSREIEKKFLELIDKQNIKVLLIYFAKEKEVQTKRIIEACLKRKIKIYLPIVDAINDKIFFARISDINNDLEKGPFGIHQPKIKKKNVLVDFDNIDLIAVPGLAFDTKGKRIGSGKGYYDKFLTMVPPHKPLIALAFELQVIDEIVQLNHDISVHKLITEKRIILCG